MGCHDECYSRMVEKPLVITAELELIMHVLHKKLSVNEQEQLYPFIPLPIINIEIVTKIIEKYDSINVCYGAAPVSKYSDIKTSFGSQYETYHGYWKHTNRLKIISSQSTISCLLCQRLLYSLKKKKTEIICWKTC
ncbi:uncharacterized protein LOC132927614 [Rhopalosiphum padi]|uniref:uncharacterized protein LOC132927614 n=1 Tax=Rhopalosiphum padi TaxID=40932 RepID=UPI00298DE2E1|nr:uncharacterized protein LOC132927614 [Rhopalosiphum padi]